MKKAVIITLVVMAIVAVLVIAVVVSIFGSLTKEKPSITASDFKSFMEQKNYSITNVKNQYAQYDYIEQAYVAVNQDKTYQIEFYELSDENYAVGFYNNNKSIFENSKGNASAQTNVSLSNYSKYTLSSNGKYMVVSRINNTVIYINADDSYRDTIKNLLNELGY